MGSTRCDAPDPMWASAFKFTSVIYREYPRFARRSDLKPSESIFESTLTRYRKDGFLPSSGLLGALALIVMVTWGRKMNF